MKRNRRWFLGCSALVMGAVVVAALSVAQGWRRGGDLQTIEHGERQRTYLLRKPATSKALHPAIIVLHGGGGNAGQAEEMSGMTKLAVPRGYVVVYPNGSGPLPRQLLTWNAGNCCAFAMENKIDDVGFISVLIDKIVRDDHVDPRRIYVTGMSNGGMMSHSLAVELSNKIAGAAPVAGALNCQLSSGEPVAMLMIHGLADKHVLVEGGRPKVGLAQDRVDRSLQEAVDYWTRRNQTRGAGSSSLRNKVTTTDYPGRFPVRVMTIKDEGHTWPGGPKGRYRGADTPSDEVNASELILDFFDKIRR